MATSGCIRDGSTQTLHPWLVTQGGNEMIGVSTIDQEVDGAIVRSFINPFYGFPQGHSGRQSAVSLDRERNCSRHTKSRRGPDHPARFLRIAQRERANEISLRLRIYLNLLGVIILRLPDCHSVRRSVAIASWTYLSTEYSWKVSVLFSNAGDKFYGINIETF
jgi:hypothetical protein